MLLRFFCFTLLIATLTGIIRLYLRYRKQQQLIRQNQLFQEQDAYEKEPVYEAKTPKPHSFQPPKAQQKIRPTLERMDGKPLDYQAYTPPSPEEEKIVGMAKPVGHWTQKILGENFGLIMARLSNKGGKHSWVNLIRAQEAVRKQKDDKGPGAGR